MQRSFVSQTDCPWVRGGVYRHNLYKALGVISAYIDVWLVSTAVLGLSPSDSAFKNYIFCAETQGRAPTLMHRGELTRQH